MHAPSLALAALAEGLVLAAVLQTWGTLFACAQRAKSLMVAEPLLSVQDWALTQGEFP